MCVRFRARALSEKMGRNCFRSISITGGADRVCMAITYIYRFSWRSNRPGSTVSTLRKRLSRSILYSISGFFDEDNYGRKIRLLHRGYRDTVEGASKRIKDTLLSTNNTKFKIKQYYSFPLFVEGYFSGMCMIILQQSLVQFSVQSEGEEDIAVSKTLFLFPSIGFREFIFLSLMVAGKCALYDTTRPKRGAAEYRQRIQM